MPKAPAARRARPLEDEYLAAGILRNKAPKRKSKGDDDDGRDNFVDAKASRNILKLGRELAEEGEAAQPKASRQVDAFGFDGSRLEDAEDDDAFGDDDAWGDDDELVEEELEIEPEDLATFNRFMPTAEDPLLQHGWGGQNREQEEPGMNLADIIMAKINAQEQGAAAQGGADLAPFDEEVELPPKVVEVYTKIGMWMARYK